MQEEIQDYEDMGIIPVDCADYANIPVDIWLNRDEDDKEYWLLTADNYMPRKGCLSGEDSYYIRSKNRDTLVKLIHEYWLPLYQNAVRILTLIEPDDTEEAARLYYWKDS